MGYKTKLKVIGSNGAILKEVEVTGDSRKDNSVVLKAYNHNQTYSQSKINIIVSNPKLIP